MRLRAYRQRLKVGVPGAERWGSIRAMSHPRDWPVTVEYNEEWERWEVLMRGDVSDRFATREEAEAEAERERTELASPSMENHSIDHQWSFYIDVCPEPPGDYVIRDAGFHYWHGTLEEAVALLKAKRRQNGWEPHSDTLCPGCWRTRPVVSDREQEIVDRFLVEDEARLLREAEARARARLDDPRSRNWARLSGLAPYDR